MSISKRTLLETTTTLGADEVLTRARTFFTTRPSLYAAFVEKEGPGFVTFRGQGGEELVIAAGPTPQGEGTRVTGSTYMFDMQVSRFFTTLPPAPSAAAAETATA